MTPSSVRAGFDRIPRGAACEATRLLLYGVESGTVEMPAAFSRHRAKCLLCQASTVRQKRLIRELALLRHEIEPAPHDLAAALDHPMVVVPDGAGDARAPRRRPVWAAVASAASLAAVGAIVVAGRRLRSRAA